MSSTGTSAPAVAGLSWATSRLITLAAGVSTASTTASASSCWHRVTKRILLGGMKWLLRCGGSSHGTATFTRVTMDTEGLVSNYNAVISTRHADIVELCQETSRV